MYYEMQYSVNLSLYLLIIYLIFNDEWWYYLFSDFMYCFWKWIINWRRHLPIKHNLVDYLAEVELTTWKKLSIKVLWNICSLFYEPFPSVFFVQIVFYQAKFCTLLMHLYFINLLVWIGWNFSQIIFLQCISYGYHYNILIVVLFLPNTVSFIHSCRFAIFSCVASGVIKIIGP